MSDRIPDRYRKYPSDYEDEERREAEWLREQRLIDHADYVRDRQKDEKRVVLKQC